MKTTKEVTITKTLVHCDICGKNSTGTCVACGRDLCQAHSKLMETNPWTGYPSGDYWQRFCHDCLDTIPPIAKYLRDEIDRLETELGGLEANWIIGRRSWAEMQVNHEIHQE